MRSYIKGYIFFILKGIYNKKKKKKKNIYIKKERIKINALLFGLFSCFICVL